MGCGPSKFDDSPLVTLCRERKEFLKAASEQRYALAAAHIAYFQSLKDIGEALRKFVDEELIIASGSSTPGSPVLRLPSDEGKGKRPKQNQKNKNSSSSTSISISHQNSPDSEEIEEGSHLHLSSGSDSHSELGSSSGHIHIEDSPERVEPSSYNYPPQGYGFHGVYGNPGFGYPEPSGDNNFTYYMKRSASRGKSVVYEEPERHVVQPGQWPDSSYGYQGAYGNGGFFEYPQMGAPPPGDYPYISQPGPSTPPPPPAPPSPPRVSAWDFFNVFDTYDNEGFPSYYSQGRYGLGSTASSPDSKEVREKEGIPELEDETEQEALKDVHKEKRKLNEGKQHAREKDFGEGTSKAVPSQSSSEGSSKTIPLHSSDSFHSPQEKEIKSSPDTIVSESSPEEHLRKKGVSFGVDEAPVTTADGESSKLSSITTLSPHGTRDLREAVQEIKDQFEIASDHGKEVAVLLEVGKLPYQSKGAAFKVVLSRMLYLVAPSMLPSHPPSQPSIRLSSRAMKLAKAYCGEPGQDSKTTPANLSATLDELYAWEKKLYKEVKDEERLRVIYEKECKRLKTLDVRGAETTKIDAVEASMRKLLTKINICIRTIDAISSRIHTLRDEKLQPQLAALIQGLIRMWKFMVKCHQKQFHAIMESKSQSIKMNTGLQRDTGLKATVELEMGLLNWCSQFNNWVKTQKSYVDSLNQWLTRCLTYEQEETADGVAPFSPGRIGAPPIFIICNDWFQAMTRISERGVADAMHEFAQKLHELWERQDEAQRQRIKAEYLSKDFEKRLRTLRMNMEDNKVSDKTALSKGPSESGVSPLDDLKVDLDSIRKRLHEERVRHKEAIKLVHDAASNSLQAGLVPIFKTLESFTSEVLKAHEEVRLQNVRDS